MNMRKFNRKIGIMLIPWFLLIIIYCVLLTYVVLHLYAENKKEKREHLAIEQKLISEIDNLTHLKFERVRCTMYNPSRSQGWGNGDTLYSGEKIVKSMASGYRYIAVSNDMLEKYPMNSFVLVMGVDDYYDGVWQVKDKLNSKYSKRIDFMQTSGIKAPVSSHCYISKLSININDAYVANDIINSKIIMSRHTEYCNLDSNIKDYIVKLLFSQSQSES